MDNKLSTVSQLVQWGAEELKSTYGQQARFEAEILLAHALHKPRVYLHTWPDAIAPENSYLSLISRRCQGEPIAYLTGHREFWSLDLEVTPDTLIPRPETETLVEHILEHIKAIKQPVIADLGTGSGAIALAIANERPDSCVIASDYSEAALAVAKSNAKRLNINNVEFVHSDWCSKLPVNYFNLIASNPPYIACDDEHLTQGDLQHEPTSALSSGKEGLDDIRKICRTANKHLQANGSLFLEHGYQQKDHVYSILNSEQYVNIGHALDINQNPRISWGSKPIDLV